MSISRLNFKPDPNLLQTIRTEADFIKVEMERRWNEEARSEEYRNTFCTMTITMTITIPYE